jgi:hypothetical protein
MVDVRNAVRPSILAGGLGSADCSATGFCVGLMFLGSRYGVGGCIYFSEGRNVTEERLRRE